jgi:hypothetical protein
VISPPLRVRLPRWSWEYVKGFCLDRYAESGRKPSPNLDAVFWPLKAALKEEGDELEVGASEEAWRGLVAGLKKRKDRPRTVGLLEEQLRNGGQKCSAETSQRKTIDSTGTTHGSASTPKRSTGSFNFSKTSPPASPPSKPRSKRSTTSTSTSTGNTSGRSSRTTSRSETFDVKAWARQMLAEDELTEAEIADFKAKGVL